ncbi:uncharacterized protein LOC128930089 [Callithrix jacchus]
MACLWLRKCAGLHEQVAAAQRAEDGGCKRADRALRTPVGLLGDWRFEAWARAQGGNRGKVVRGGGGRCLPAGGRTKRSACQEWDSNPRLQGRLRPERSALDRSAILTARRGPSPFACLGALGRCVPCATHGSRGRSRHRVNSTGWLWRGRPGVPTPDPNHLRGAGRPCTPPPPRLRRRDPRRARAHQVLGAAAWLFRRRLFLPARSLRWRQQTGRTERFHATRTRSCRGPAPDPGGIAGCCVGCRVRSRHRWRVAGDRSRAGTCRALAVGRRRGSRQGSVSAVGVGSGVPLTVAVVLVSIVVSIPACHAGDRGSIPRRGGSNPFWAPPRTQPVCPTYPPSAPQLAARRHLGPGLPGPLVPVASLAPLASCISCLFLSPAAWSPQLGGLLSPPRRPTSRRPKVAVGRGSLPRAQGPVGDGEVRTLWALSGCGPARHLVYGSGGPGRRGRESAPRGRQAGSRSDRSRHAPVGRGAALGGAVAARRAAAAGLSVGRTDGLTEGRSGQPGCAGLRRRARSREPRADSAVGGIVESIAAFQAVYLGSIPGQCSGPPFARVSSARARRVRSWPLAARLCAPVGEGGGGGVWKVDCDRDQSCWGRLSSRFETL